MALGGCGGEVAVNECKAFRVRRAQEGVLRLAREWSRANATWRAHDGDGREDDRLYEVQSALNHRLEAACHDLVAREAET
jgi:hypothetical protein